MVVTCSIVVPGVLLLFSVFFSSRDITFLKDRNIENPYGVHMRT